MTNEPSESGLATELEELRTRLAESEEALHAIRNGQVDAVVVAGGRGEQTYTLRGASRVYRRLVETMSEGAVTLAANGVILYGNARFAEMLERSLDRVLGKALRDYLPTKDQQALDAALAQARTETSRREINLKTSEGHLVPVYLSASRLQSEGAEMVFCLVLTDLTEQRSHEQVAAAERLASLILAQAAEAIVVCDGQGRVIRASQAAQRFCDGSPLLRPFAEAFPLRTETAESFHLAPVLQGETLRDVDVALVRQGQKINLILNAGPLLSGRQILGCAITLTDISERKRMEESHARLATVVEQVAETILITDVNAAILYANPAFEKTTGFTPAEAIGQNPRILKSGKQDAEFYRQMWAVLARGEVWNGHMINKRKDGTFYEEDASITPIRNAAGTIVNYVSVQCDVTREAQLESQLLQAQKMEVIGRLAGGVAHDFNNILMAVMGYSDLALKTLPADDPARRHIEEVRAAGERAAGLTRQLLAFSRKQVLVPKVLDLNDLVSNLSRMLRRLIGENILLTTILDPAAGRVKADPGQIEQVITNLAVNARDAMPDGGTLTLQRGNVDLDEAYAGRHAEVTPGRYVLLTILDTGTGMTEEVKAHLFEPFFTTKDQGKGTGLGLPTVYGIVKQSGGHVTVYSEAGHGTTFKVYLPHVEEAGAAAVPIAGPIVLARGTETVLLVEDEEQVRNLTQIVLEECGYTVLVAGNGPDALRLAERHKGKIHLLVTDVIMPGMSGRVLAPLLVGLKPDLRVLYMSGYTEASIIRQDLMTAGSTFLQKPFSLDVLARKVREVLDAPVPAPAMP